MVKRILVTLFLISVIPGCMTAKWDTRQIETTFLNEETGAVFVQKNTVLINTKTGESWIFDSDGNSNYSWVEMPFSDSE